MVYAPSIETIKARERSEKVELERTAKLVDDVGISLPRSALEEGFKRRNNTVDAAREPQKLVAVRVRQSDLPSSEIFSIVGELLDIGSERLTGFILGLTENESPRENVAKIEDYFTSIQKILGNQIAAILIKNSDPEVGIKNVEKKAMSMLRMSSMSEFLESPKYDVG